MIEHKSSGGFVFYRDEENNKTYVALLTNKAGVIWIPKGHIKNGENDLCAAFREIKEELGLRAETIRHIGFVSKDEYTWTYNDTQHHKELFIHAFFSEKMQILKSEVDEDIISTDWYEIEDALEKITYNKNDLVKAGDLFLQEIKKI